MVFSCQRRLWMPRER
uniref:Predicted gene, 66057 n=1 Tax=Mus musculus TaxID=10090 RepID=A0AAQ4VMP7_MOUSE